MSELTDYIKYLSLLTRDYNNTNNNEDSKILDINEVIGKVLGNLGYIDDIPNALRLLANISYDYNNANSLNKLIQDYRLKYAIYFNFQHECKSDNDCTNFCIDSNVPIPERTLPPRPNIVVPPLNPFLPINNYLSIVGYILFLIHPLVNVLGSYSQINGGLRIEPLVLTIGFIVYKLVVNPVPFNKIYTTKDNVFKYNFANYLNKYEIAAYLLLLIAPMFLYDPPKNAVMMSSTVFLLFISWVVNRRKLDRSISEWHNYLTSLLGVNMLFL